MNFLPKKAVRHHLSQTALRCVSAILLMGLCCNLPGQNAAATGSDRNSPFEQDLVGRLRGISPDAAAVFEKATSAMDAGDMETAATGFAQVLTLIPDQPDAMRRMSYVRIQQGEYDQAIRLARRAEEQDPSAFNKSALATALMYREDSLDTSTILRLARDAYLMEPEEISVVYTYLFAAMYANDREAMHQTLGVVAKLIPDDPSGHYYRGLLAVDEGNWDLADTELRKAAELGMPQEEIDRIYTDADIVAQLALNSAKNTGLVFLIAWVLSLPFFFLIGSILSPLTLRAAKRNLSGGLEIRGPEKVLRTVYGAVINITSLLFYISIPILIALILFLGGAVLYVFFAVGSIPIYLFIVVLAAVGYSLLSLLRSIFTKIKDEEPGRSLALDEAPDLWEVSREVAQRVGTREIERIFITPGTEIAVVERGGFLKKLGYKGERCLILGLGVLRGLPLPQFKAILAHEYGHFSNRDTAGGGFANQVRASVYTLALNLAQTGQARWYNPAWLFINAFHRVFMRVTLGASRLREILADRYSAVAYGAENFCAGLTHVMRQSLIFDIHADKEITKAGSLKVYTLNLYAPPEVPEQEYVSKLEEQLARPSSAYDSHPAPKDRFEFVRALRIAPVYDLDNRHVLQLLVDPEKLMGEMVEVVQKRLKDRQPDVAEN